MILSMSEQAVIFLLSILTGVVFGFVYDLFRILRKAIPHNSFFTQLEDFLYWCVVTLMMFYIVLNSSGGQLRFFNFLGAGIGITLYFGTISIIFMKVSVALIHFFKKVLKFIISLILAPFRFLGRIVRIPIRFCMSLTQKQIKSLQKLLHKTNSHVRIRIRKTITHIKIAAKKT